jgi:RNA polymerase sigma factor (sigma-70 family)
VRQHDPAFDAVFARCFPQAFAMAARLVGRSMAEDIAAEALTRTYQRWSKVRDLSYLDAWVMRVAANLVVDAVRRNRRAPALTSDRGPAEHDLADVLALRAALRRLPRRQQEAVVLRRYAGLTGEEVATLLGIGASTVDTHLARGLAALQTMLDDPKEQPSWTT